MGLALYLGHWSWSLTGARESLVPVRVVSFVRSLCSARVQLHVEDTAEVRHHGVHILFSRLPLSWNVVRTQVSLLSESHFVFLSCHGRGIQAHLHVLAVAFSHYFFASRIESPMIHSVRGVRAVKIWVSSFMCLDLLKDLFTKMLEWNIFTRLSSSNHLRQSSLGLDVTF